MRIATVCFSATVGGLELGTLRRGAELQERGHTVTAVLPDAPELVRRAELLGLRVDRLTPSIPYLDLAAARMLSTIFNRDQIEAAIVARSRDLSTVMLAAGRTVAVILHQQMQSGIDKRDWFHNRVFRRLDACITITRKGREEVLANTVLEPQKIAVVAPGLDLVRFSPEALTRVEARATLGAPEESFVVGIVGGFNPGKGQREFITALGVAAEREPALAAEMHGMLIGERSADDRAYGTELRALRDALPIAERIAFHPFAEDPRHGFRALDVFVLASHSETFGMVVQEAMAMGVPVIATDAGGVPEIVTHEETGLLVPPNDPEAIAEAVIRLYREPELRAALAHNARRFVLEQYASDRQSAAFETIVINAVQRRREKQ